MKSTKLGKGGGTCLRSYSWQVLESDLNTGLCPKCSPLHVSLSRRSYLWKVLKHSGGSGRDWPLPSTTAATDPFLMAYAFSTLPAGPLHPIR